MTSFTNNNMSVYLFISKDYRFGEWGLQLLLDLIHVLAIICIFFLYFSYIMDIAGVYMCVVCTYTKQIPYILLFLDFSFLLRLKLHEYKDTT